MDDRHLYYIKKSSLKKHTDCRHFFYTSYEW
jgi:hypothetical protein